MRRHNLSTLLSVVFTLAILTFGIGCKNHLLSQPTFGGGQNGTQDNQQTAGSAVSFGAPANLQSTQGGSREITLTWNPVTDAARYNVYRASTQFDTFVQVGEATSDKASYTMKVPAGADFYYRVTAVNYGGEESPFSSIVRGTALATPLISGIEGVEGKEDSDVTVYWYMGNVDAYQNQVRYNVICYDSKGAELARVVVDGSRSDKTEAVIPNLTPNTDYQYKVEAYLVTAQDKVEAGDPMDAATARRLRPNAPEELKVEQGQSKDGITLSFKLPALVDVALPGGLYEQKPLYFKIYRRKFVEGSTDTEKGWELVKADFGKTTEATEGEPQLVKFGAEDEEYTPGNLVTWTDTDKNLDRGVKYEYKVQSFAYVTNRDISSDLSTATNHGWLIAEAHFGTSTYTTVKDNAENPTKNVSAELNFSFEFDDMGIKYHYLLQEEYWSLESDSTSGNSEPKGTNLIAPSNSVDDINSYTRIFDLSKPEDTRGYYKYRLFVMTAEQHETTDASLEVIAVGQVLVTDSLTLPVIKLFSVENTSENKIKLSWDYNEGYKYAIKYSENGGEEEYLLNEQSQDQPVGNLSKDGIKTGDTISFTDNPGEGKTRIYTLYALDDVNVSSWPITASTFTTPKLEKTTIDYDDITVKWDDVIADSYLITAVYEDTTIAKNYTIDSGSINKRIPTDLASDKLEYTFKQPSGYDKYSVSGLPVKISVEAKVTPLKTVHTLVGSEGSSYDIKTDKLTSINLKSEELISHTLGPASVDAVASQGTEKDCITLTWNAVEGASAYAIIRNRMHIADSSQKVFQSTDTYIVSNTSASPTVALANSSEDISQNVTIKSQTLDGGAVQYILTDSSLSELPQGASKWQIGQSQISWGAPYEYAVFPLSNANEEIVYDYETSKTSTTLAEVPFTEVAFKDGGTSGFGWNVTATKGNYVADDSKENTAIKVTWSKPWFAKETDTYTIFRREENTSGNWTTLFTGKPVKDGVVDSSATPGTVYEYMVSLDGTVKPEDHKAWYDFLSTHKDEVYTTEKASIGFVLPLPQLTSASKDKNYTDKELLSWPSATVGKQRGRMFEGYIIEVMNNNIDAEWHEIARFTFGKDNFDGTKRENEQYVYNKDNLLKVLRDYKHYFRIRAFTDGGNVLSKAPEYTWSDGHETEHVRWGARQLTPAEYNKCVTLVLAYGLRLVNSTEWNTGYFGRDKDATSPGSGTMHAESDFWVTDWTIKYTNYRQGYTTKSGRVLPSFLCVNGTLNAQTGASNQYPKSYSTSNGITVTGPSEVNGMYNGTITFSSSSGNSSVNFTGGSGSFSYSKDSSYSPLPMDGGDYKVDSEEWK